MRILPVLPYLGIAWLIGFILFVVLYSYLTKRAEVIRGEPSQYGYPQNINHDFGEE